MGTGTGTDRSTVVITVTTTARFGKVESAVSGLGSSVFLIAATADGTELARVDDPPKPLAAVQRQQRRLAKSLARKKRGSRNRHHAAARLARHSLIGV